MVLFVSDMHFGRTGAPDAEKAEEADLLRCLDAFDDELEHLYLVGDVFDAFIEYSRLVPKGFVRFQGRIASLTDRGIPVTYLLGNHDPWHADYFTEELGVDVVPDHCVATHYGHRVLCAHGDHLAGSAGGLTTRFRSLLRHPACVALYRTLLPANLGFGLAQWVSRQMHDRTPNPDLVQTLAERGHDLIKQDRADMVVMGHSHVPTLQQNEHGMYLNTGTWFADRTFVVLTEPAARLMQWNGRRAEIIESADFQNDMAEAGRST
ncbi:UDP-2,3-diacylglucosamine hydrolase [Longibacter salinarum]|uniref:UDP-2,3-diacylglucosamine hydrolase n=1 Tax=Longibacter salinarum TaxID=1850348 RepID=A0A2A8D0D1_9BACT|nr:UDP-2,3-diacylglucosamine diphosphatase [Longibacter salinarum]PEN14344.1 UDP-2,3-diacylglucosamine hydrolase [Longibacter salinarum]